MMRSVDKLRLMYKAIIIKSINRLDDKQAVAMRYIACYILGGFKNKIMKETLKERIERMRMNLVNRIEMLDKNIIEYKESDNYEKAMINDIKLKQLFIILNELDEALK